MELFNNLIFGFSVALSLAMVVVGLLLGIVGTDVNSGIKRFTFGFYELADGIGVVTIAVGVFAVGEILSNLSDPEERQVFTSKVTNLFPTREDLKRSFGAIMIYGISPGPQVMTEKPDLFWGLIASMWIGNGMLLVLNLPLIGMWVSLLKLPYRLLFPAIMAFSAIGIYSVNNSSFDIYLMGIFGILGIVWRLLDCSPVPMMLGFVLGPMVEENLRRALQISRGDPSVFVTRPISLAFIVATVLILIVMAAPTVRKRWDTA